MVLSLILWVKEVVALSIHGIPMDDLLICRLDERSIFVFIPHISRNAKVNDLN